LTNEASVDNLRVRLAFLELAASLALGGSLVRSALLSDKVTLLTEEAVEKWPTSVASLVEVVAVHQEGARKLGHFFAIFHLESVLHDLDNRHCVARTTGTLVDVIAHKVDTLDVSQVKALGKFLIRDLTGSFILFLIFLGLTQGSFEVFMLTKLNLGLSFLLKERSVITVVAVARMSLLKLANISLPAKIIFINGVNE